MDDVVRQRAEGLDRSLPGRRRGRRAHRLVHQRQNFRAGQLQGRQARRNLEALGRAGLQELGRGLQGRQADLVSERMTNDFEIIEADLADSAQAAALIELFALYMRDPMEGGVAMPPNLRCELVPALRAHPASYVFLAYHAGAPIGFAICFLGFSTFNARPLLNIHDISVLGTMRGKGAGAAMLARIELKARTLNCCR